MSESMTEFRKRVRRYYRAHWRDFAWRRTRDSYHILVSEIMLQQTQVARVEKFYPRFLAQFSNFRALAKASTKDVLRAWQGMGYNRRALALKKIAEVVARDYKGKLPRDPELLAELPGIGKATAGAVAAFAFNQPVSFIETNIRRAFLYHFFKNRKGVPDTAVLKLVEQALDKKNAREWYYALMDYGAMLGKQKENPNRRSKHYARQSKFVGSNRELRGKLLRAILKGKGRGANKLARAVSEPIARVREVMRELKKEGFIAPPYTS